MTDFLSETPLGQDRMERYSSEYCTSKDLLNKVETKSFQDQQK